MSLVDDILSQTNEILGLRDDLGAIKKPVFILTRTWTTGLGKGTPTDVAVQVLPTPYVVDLSLDYRVKEGGNIRQGDLLIKSISRQNYAEKTDVDCTVEDSTKIEKWYLIDNELYEVINVTKKYVTWDVHIRKTIKKKDYL